MSGHYALLLGRLLGEPLYFSRSKINFVIKINFIYFSIIYFFNFNLNFSTHGIHGWSGGTRLDNSFRGSKIWQSQCHWYFPLETQHIARAIIRMLS
jgi:hypothetical protein